MARTDKSKRPRAGQPSEAPYLSAGERRTQGKALRVAVPRQSQAGWKPKKDRRDPVELLIESNAGRVENLIPIRHGRMWSLTMPQIAATLAAALVAFQTRDAAGQRLLDQDMLHAVLVMLVVTSVIGLVLTQRFASRLVRGA
jgi:hypothetical protein